MAVNIQLIKELREATGAGMMDAKKALENSDSLDSAIDWLRKNGIAKAAKKSDRIAAEGIISIYKNQNKIGIMEVNSETDFVASNEKFIKSVDQIINKFVDSDISTQEELLNLKFDDNLTIGQQITELISKIGEKISIRRFLSFDLKDISVGFYLHSNFRIGTIVISNNPNEDEKLLKDIAIHIAAMNPKFASIDDVPEDYIEKEKIILTEQYREKFANKPENILKNIVESALQKHLNESILLEQDFVKNNDQKIKDLINKNSKIRFIRYEVGEGIEKQIVNFAEEVKSQLKK